MPSPRRQRDFSNISNMGKKKKSNQKRRDLVPKNNIDPSLSIEAFRKEAQKKRITQLLDGDAKEPTDVVFQDTDVFQVGVDTIKDLTLKNQTIISDAVGKLPMLGGVASKTAKLSRFNLYTTDSTKTRFDKALKKELNKTKKSLRQNNSAQEPENAFKQQRKKTVGQKKQAAEESSHRKGTEMIGNPKEEDPKENIDQIIIVDIKKTTLPLEEKGSSANSTTTNSTEIKDGDTVALREEHVMGAIQDHPQIIHQQKRSQKESKPIEKMEQVSKTGFLQKLVARIFAIFPSRKAQKGIVKLDEKTSKPYTEVIPSQLKTPQPEKSVLLLDSGTITQIPELDLTVEKLDPSDYTSEENLVEQEDIKVALIQETDPLQELRDQKPVYLGVLRKIIASAENPVHRMAQLLTQQDDELTFSDAQTLINYVATPWAVMNEINYQPRLNFLQSFADEHTTPNSLDEQTLDLVIQTIDDTIDRELLDLMFEVLTNQAIFSKAELVEVVDDFAKAYPKTHQFVVLSHIIGRTQSLLSGWNKHPSLDKYEDICTNNMYYMKEKFSPETIAWATDIFSAFALEHPKKILSDFSLRKHNYSNDFENRVQNWVEKHLPGHLFIIEDDLKEFQEKKFGIHKLRPRKKYPHIKNTPDILFANPVSVEGNDTKILWIDAKLAMFDPAFTEEGIMKTLLSQMERYVTEYGPGLMVWGKPFSQEWNEHTQPAVMHTTMEEMKF